MDARDGDIADSTDWLGTALACLMPLEQALRCHVCKDLYTSPMLTSCNHTFCSLCIRRCLSVDGKCPLCRMGDQESKLRGNWALREAVDAFCRARPALLGVARTPPPPPPVITVVRAASPGPVSVPVPVPVPRRSKRRQGDGDNGDGDADYDDGSSSSKRTRSSARLSKTRAAEAVTALATAQQRVESSETEDEDLDVDSEPGGVPDKADEADGAYEPDDGLVACPICWARMRPLLVDRHLDTTCPGSPRKPPKQAPPQSQPQAAASAPGSIWQRIGQRSGPATMTPEPPPERLPSLSYSLLSDTALRKKLAQLGLATGGPRPLLERRHREWATLWNANCDAARPKRKAELLHDLEVWERTMGGGGGGGGGGLGGLAFGSTLASRSTATATAIKEKDFDAAAWSARHSTAFKDLVASARKSAGAGAGARPSGEGGPGRALEEGVPPEMLPPAPDANTMAPGPDLDETTLRGPVVKHGGEALRPKELEPAEAVVSAAVVDSAVNDAVDVVEVVESP